MAGRRKFYIADGITIIWQPDLCCHSGICVHKLPDVYRPLDRPWIRPEFATKEELIEQIGCCPSGALSYRINDDAER